MEKISVIIPTYNRKKIIAQAIDSVLLQTYNNFEIIIIDDGSCDGSKEFLREKYGDLIRVIEKKHSGVSGARNLGIKEARGDIIALLDSDDLFSQDKLAKQLAYMQKNTEYKICHSEEIWIKDGIRINPHKKHKKRGGYIFKESVELCLISASTVMVRKEIFAELGCFDEEMPACEDYDFWLRVTAKYPVLFLDEHLTTKFGGHEDQLSKKYWGMDRFRIYALDKILQGRALSLENKEVAQEMLLKKLKIFLKGAMKHNNLEYVERYEEMLGFYES